MISFFYDFLTEAMIERLISLKILAFHWDHRLGHLS